MPTARKQHRPQQQSDKGRDAAGATAGPHRMLLGPMKHPSSPDTQPPARRLTQQALGTVTSFPSAVAMEVTRSSHFLFGNFLIPRRSASDNGKLPLPVSFSTASGHGLSARLRELGSLGATYSSRGQASRCFHAVWFMIPL